jgi:hypothetical protein
VFYLDLDSMTELRVTGNGVEPLRKLRSIERCIVGRRAYFSYAAEEGSEQGWVLTPEVVEVARVLPNGDEEPLENGFPPVSLQIPSPEVEASGDWEVLTRSGSEYRFDLDLGVAWRYPQKARPNPLAGSLRHDREPLILLDVIRCRLGEPALYIVDLRLPGAMLTRRETATVISIRQIPTQVVDSP